MDVKLNVTAFREVFSNRIKALSLIRTSLHSQISVGADIKVVGDRIVAESEEFDTRDAKLVYEVFGRLVVVYSRLVDWMFAVRAAEPDADRHRRSAEFLLSELTDIVDAVDVMGRTIALAKSVTSVTDLPVFRDSLLSTPLEISYDAPGSAENRELAVEEARKALGGSRSKAEKKQTTVAFLRFDIDGAPAGGVNYVEPKVSHDLTLELRVSHWPKEAECLRLVPISVDDLTKHDLPEFVFSAPTGKSPHVLKETKRAVINTAHSMGSRPYEFKYAATFEPEKSIRDVEIVGHRTLRIEGTDINANPISGFPNIDRRLLDIRDRIRLLPGLPSEDIANLIRIAAVLGNYASQAARTGRLPAGMSERDFQERVAEALRLSPQIGAELDEHPQSGGGITDLSFKGIVIELKAEQKSRVTLDSCKQFFDQASAYAIGYGKRVAVISVLDSTKKNSPVGPVEEDIGLHFHQVNGKTICLVVVIVQAGLASPSSFSR